MPCGVSGLRSRRSIREAVWPPTGSRSGLPDVGGIHWLDLGGTFGVSSGGGRARGGCSRSSSSGRTLSPSFLFFCSSLSRSDMLVLLGALTEQRNGVKLAKREPELGVGRCSNVVFIDTITSGLGIPRGARAPFGVYETARSKRLRAAGRRCGRRLSPALGRKSATGQTSAGSLAHRPRPAPLSRAPQVKRPPRRQMKSNWSRRLAAEAWWWWAGRP